MKTIEIDQYVIEVDAEKTLEHSKTIEKCQCEDCKNYRKQIEGYNEKLNEFLKDFGIDITCPEELSTYESDIVEHTVEYIAYYSVKGEVKEFDEYKIEIDDLNVFISKPEVDMVNTDMPAPYFFISVNNICLKWAMEVDYEDVYPVKHPRKRNKILHIMMEKITKHLKNLFWF